MPLQDIAKLLGLQGVKIINHHYVKDVSEGIKEVHIRIEPQEAKQDCPCCGSGDVVRKGKNGNRKITHLKIGVTPCMLIAPNIKLECKSCSAGFSHTYSFIEGKERHTEPFKAHVYEIAVGSTVEHAATLTETPYSTAERFFKETAIAVAKKTLETVQQQAESSQKLILGLDDFAIRKGHNYNTGFHDLRGESLIGIAEGRKIEELHTYMENNPQIAVLKPYAIIMDLARGYHTFAQTYFPDAIRIADRFHVNGYIMDALNEIRRRVGKGLPTASRTNLNRKRHLLNKRNENLSSGQQEELKELLGYSYDLACAYLLKEQLADWYDCSFNYQSACHGFKRWIENGHKLGIPEIETALKTFENWQDEILNYHKCRFTNGIVEGRNGKIKSIQRRHFFLRNRQIYEALCIIECNKEIAHEQFILLSA
jgi:transposase